MKERCVFCSKEIQDGAFVIDELNNQKYCVCLTCVNKIDEDEDK